MIVANVTAPAQRSRIMYGQTFIVAWAREKNTIPLRLGNIATFREALVSSKAGGIIAI